MGVSHDVLPGTQQAHRSYAVPHRLVDRKNGIILSDEQADGGGTDLIYCLIYYIDFLWGCLCVYTIYRCAHHSARVESEGCLQESVLCYHVSPGE